MGQVSIGMGVLERIVGRQRQIGGDLDYFGLGAWWHASFSKAERQYMETLFVPAGLPAGSRPLTQDHGAPTFSTPAALLVALAACLRAKAEDRDLASQVLAKAEERARTENDIIGLHFAYQEMIHLHYKWRDQFGNAEDLAFAACHKQTRIAAEAAEALRAKSPEKLLPAHLGFQRTASILEKRGAYEQAIEICRRAKRQGWTGNWAWRMHRMARRLHGRGYPVVGISASGMSRV